MENLTIEQKEKELRDCGVMCHIADIEEAKTESYLFLKKRGEKKLKQKRG